MQRSLVSFGDIPSLRAQLHESLEDYQRERVEGAKASRSILLADETGLGKSASALASLESLDAYPAIIVTPASARPSLLAECRKWLPWRTSAIMDGDEAPSAEIVILHPEVLERNLYALLRTRPKGAFFDESVYYKNHQTRRSKAAMTLAQQVRVRILSSATPVANERADLYGQLELLGRTNEVLRAGYASWRRPCPDLSTIELQLAALKGLPRDSLHKALTATVMYRTTHAKQKKGQAPITRRQVQCIGARSPLYEALEQQFVAYCREVSKLRLDEKKERAKARIRASSMINGMRAALGAAKVDKVREMALRMKADGRKAVIFVYHRDVAQLLGAALPGKVLVVTGETPKPERRRIFEQFAQADFLVATMRSMSMGVNGLQQSASTLLFVEYDPAASTHEQCEGRLRRNGQTKRVAAHYLVAPDSVDEASLATLQRKWRDAKGITDGKEAARSGNFAEQVLMSVIAQRPWENGGKIDWSAAGKTRIKRGDQVTKPGRNGPMFGKVVWCNGARTSYRVEWSDGMTCFELPASLTVVPPPKAAAPV